MDKLGPVQLLRPMQTIQPKQVNNEPNAPFMTLFQDALQNINATQKESEALTQKLVTGEIQDVHQVMIASQKASISLQLAVQVRNKVIESYQEIMRMQV